MDLFIKNLQKEECYEKKSIDFLGNDRHACADAWLV